MCGIKRTGDKRGMDFVHGPLMNETTMTQAAISVQRENVYTYV